MNSSPSIIIDPGLLAVPAEDCYKDDIHEYIDTLLQWSELLNDSNFRAFVSDRASELLIEGNFFPIHKQLKEIFVVHGIVEYDVNTVVKIANRLLSTTPTFESFYKVSDVLSDSIEIKPQLSHYKSFTPLYKNLERCIILLSILRKHCSQISNNHIFLLKETSSNLLKVKSQIHEIDHERDDLSTFSTFPQIFEGDVLACDSFNSFISCLDSKNILTNAINDSGIELAIKIALFKFEIIQGNSPDWDSIKVPVIGKKFYDLCIKICAEQGETVPDKILRSIVETVRNEKLTAVHALRTGAGGSDPQKMRDKDKAQRRDIDRELHLHYWECPGGSIELASIVYHNDFTIPE